MSYQDHKRAAWDIVWRGVDQVWNGLKLHMKNYPALTEAKLKRDLASETGDALALIDWIKAYQTKAHMNVADSVSEALILNATTYIGGQNDS